MTPEEIRDQKIQDYVHNRMTADERIAFEKEMETDVELRDDVQLLADLKTIHEPDGLLDLKKKLLAVESELEKEGFFERIEKEKQPDLKILKPEKQKTILQKYWWAAAASVLLIISAILFLQKPNYEQIALQTAREDIFQTRGSMHNASKLFNEGKYTEYIDAAKQLLSSDTISTDDKIKMYYNTASAYLLLKKPDAAFSLIDASPPEIKETCVMLFAEATAYVYIKEKEKAETILKRILEDESLQCYPLRYVNELMKKL